MTPERRSTPTWQWIAVTALSILIGIAGYAYTDTQKQIRDLRDKKADIEDVREMKNDVREVKAMMTTHVMQSGYGTVPKGEIP